MSQPIVISDTEVSYVVFAESDSSVVFCESPETFVVFVEGAQGLPGTPGEDGTGDITYTHTQSSPTTTWTITHNLGKHPSVTIVDSAGTQVLGQVVHDSANQITATFSSAFSGKAYLN